MRTDAELEKAVKEGAAVLDLERAEWEAQIDLGRLEISDCFKCALGQTYGSYGLGVEALGHADDASAGFDWAVAHGFDAAGEQTWHGRAVEYKLLAALWAREVEARR